MLPAWTAFVASSLGSYLGGLQGGSGADGHCECQCCVSFEGLPEPSESVLRLLDKQLERCGPERLVAAACPAVPLCPACPAQAKAAACPKAKAAAPPACPAQECPACPRPDPCPGCPGLPWWLLLAVAVASGAAGFAAGRLVRCPQRRREPEVGLLQLVDGPGRQAPGRVPAAAAAGSRGREVLANTPKLRQQLPAP